MKTRKILLLLTGLLVSANISAQWRIGLAGGCVINHLTVDKGYFYNRQYSPETSFSIAIPVAYQFNEWFALGTEASFLNKNYSWERNGNYIEYQDHEKVRNSYIQIPVMANFSAGGKRLRGFANLGMFAGAWVNSHIKGTYLTVYDNSQYDYDGPYTFNPEKDNRFEYGLLAGAGLQYQTRGTLGIFAEARYLYSLSNLQKQYSEHRFSRYNNSLQIQIGVTFKLK